MSVSAFLGTVIGMVFVFALAALFCSAVVESISNVLQKRARYLLTGLRAMLDEDPKKASAVAGQSETSSNNNLHNLTRGIDNGRTPADSLKRIKETIIGKTESAKSGDLTLSLFAHPLISSLQTRRIMTYHHGQRNKRTLRNPQYIPSKLFAQALIDTLLPDTVGRHRNGGVLEQIEKSVNELPATFPGRASIQTLLVQAGDSLSTFQRNLEGWYDAQMGRISGLYKRWSKVTLGVVGLLLAVVVNVDAVRIAHTLYVNEPVRQAVVAQATSDANCAAMPGPTEKRHCVEDLVASLAEGGLPLLYPAGCSFHDLPDCWKWADDDRPDPRMFLVKLMGWLLAAFAVSFGAPFWFDALSRLGSLSTAGPKPGAASSSSP
jgi:hypothetical protein